MGHSTLSAVKPKLQLAAAAYGRNRPAIQRLVQACFVAYAISTTVKGLSGKGPSPDKPRKRSKRSGKGPRVEVRRCRRPAAVSQTPSSSCPGCSRLPFQVDAVFFERLKRLLRIVIPSWHSSEAGFIALHSALLLFRTVLSLYVAELDGRIVSSLVRGQPWGFAGNLVRWIAIAIPATGTNSLLEFCQSKLELSSVSFISFRRSSSGLTSRGEHRYRTKLTQHVVENYLDSSPDSSSAQVFYQLSNLDDRIKGPDQFIVADIALWSKHLAELYSNLAKPILDTVLFNYQLSKNVGAEGARS